MVLPINQVHSVDNYPYGYKVRTTAHFKIEMKPNGDNRLVFTTINPKTGKENKPKNGTYCKDGLNYLSKDERGYITHHEIRFNGFDSANKFIKFMHENSSALGLTVEQSGALMRSLFGMIKANALYTSVGEENTQAFLECLKPTLQAIVDAIKTGAKDWDNIPMIATEDIERMQYQHNLKAKEYENEKTI